jgi:predicted nucleic acid-binding protein
MIAVSDTGPILYLNAIGRIGLLPQIFKKVLIPDTVADELTHPSAPREVAVLIARPPAWLDVRPVLSMDARLGTLGPGERHAIELASSVGADVFLTDDALAKDLARRVKALKAYGTIGVLYEAAMNRSIVFTPEDFDRTAANLLSTNFFAGAALRKSIEDLSRRLHESQPFADRER